MIVQRNLVLAQKKLPEALDCTTSFDITGLLVIEFFSGIQWTIPIRHPKQKLITENA